MPPAAEVCAFFAVAAPGLEAMVACEVAALVGASAVAAVPGGVTFTGPLTVGWDANLRLRVATRVLLRIGLVEARDFAALERKLARLPWSHHLHPAQPIRVQATASKCRLHHTGALAQRLQQALGLSPSPSPLRTSPAPLLTSPAPRERSAPQAPGEGGEGGEEGGVAPTLILIRGERDRFTISLDTSGDLLHRRGYRPEAGRAPLRETLAAGMLALAGWDGSTPLLDPMCGAGTIAIEAALFALRAAPGLGRAFAFEQSPRFDCAAYARLLERAHSDRLPRLPAPIFARDRSAAAIDRARRNADRAGVAAHIDFSVADFPATEPPCATGLLIANPPYGHRLGGRSTPRALLADLHAARAGAYRGFHAAWVVPDERGAPTPGPAPAQAHPLDNGGLSVRLLIFPASYRSEQRKP